MDEARPLQKEFANRVIRQFADHLLGTDLIIEPKDYLVLRLIYRKLGGSWLPFFQGDIKAVTLLENVITGWGKMPNRKRETSDE